MIWVGAGPVVLPFRCWPMQIALESLEAEAPSTGRLGWTLDHWPAGFTSAGRCRPGLDSMLRALARSGALTIEGRGWNAGYLPSRMWFEECSIALASLSSTERAAISTAAQRLVASVTIWSKKSRTDLSESVSTS